MYLENGQEVNLDKALTDENDKTMYLVTQIYIGETFRVSGAGGYGSGDGSGDGDGSGS